MKEYIDTLDATPSKRLYLSIIADYDLNRAICELVDNALDIWTRGQRTADLRIEVVLDKNQQTISVLDNAGGIAADDLSVAVAPGHTTGRESDEIIGIFGVGTKRAVVALAQEVKIRTRQRGDTLQVEFDDDWINESENWELPVYKVSGIAEGTTEIQLVKLRSAITDDTESHLRYHLGATYAIFLRSRGLTLMVNGQRVSPITFDNWAFPPKYEPRNYRGSVLTEDGKQVRVHAIGGLSRESSPAGGEYGVYFYCNDRLVGKALKTFDVGFDTGLAGKPHADISLARVIVLLNGEARLMPWNSSKSDINPSHEVFRSLRRWLLQVVKDYTSLSRRLSKYEGGWHTHVFPYASGTVIDVAIPDFPSVNSSYLPPLPESRPRYARVIRQANRAVSSRKPWTTGLYETMIAVNWVLKQNLEQKNRIALILLDSTLEIGFKEFLVNDSATTYSDRRLQDIFADRTQVHAEVAKAVAISKSNWKKIKHYYGMRCQLVHRRASVTVSDREIADFRATVEIVLKKLFKLRFGG